MNAAAPTNEDLNWHKMKYEKLKEEHKRIKDRNEELEERMLNLVEGVEQEKGILTHERDQLLRSLTLANNRIARLEEDCANYKKDCVLAVNLLHCQPQNYVQQLAAPNVPPLEIQDSKRKITSVVRGTTFPPMAAYLTEEADGQPDDPIPTQEETSSSTLKSSASFTSEFIERIKNDQRYSLFNLKQCSNCGGIQSLTSRETQTYEQQAPLPRIISTPARYMAELDFADVI